MQFDFQALIVHNIRRNHTIHLLYETVKMLQQYAEIVLTNDVSFHYYLLKPDTPNEI
jgi:hypothetical protein